MWPSEWWRPSVTVAHSVPVADVTSLGEALLRLTAPSGMRIAEAPSFDTALAGAELNVAAALAAVGREAIWFGALPRNALGSYALRRMRQLGIGTSGVRWEEGGRLGTYYVDLAQPPRPVQVTYDRKDSAAANMKPQDVDWNALVETRIVHLTGITPALSRVSREVTERALAESRQAGVPVSFDVNYRSALWRPEDAAEWVAHNVEGVELLFIAERDARQLFEASGSTHDVARQLWERLKPRLLVVTCGDRGSLSFDGDVIHEQEAVPVEIVDRLGAGDAFAAGVIDGWLDGDAAEGMRRGAMLAGLALAQRGDQVVTDRAELHRLLAAVGRSGSIQR